jgi:hypothetical protein
MEYGIDGPRENGDVGRGKEGEPKGEGEVGWRKRRRGGEAEMNKRGR